MQKEQDVEKQELEPCVLSCTHTWTVLSEEHFHWLKTQTAKDTPVVKFASTEKDKNQVHLHSPAYSA